MALFIYDAEADVLYVLLVDEREASIHRTAEVSTRLRVDLDRTDRVVGIEIDEPSAGVDRGPVRDRFGVAVDVPFSFAAA